MTPWTRRLSLFILPLSSFILLDFCGCRASAPPAPPKEIIEEIPPQVQLWLQVIALRETANASDAAPFPAPGFQFAGDRVVPVGKPDTIAGAELTPQQLARWMENLRKTGATLVAAPGFTVGPNLSASSVNSTEKRYQANWRVDSDGASPQNAAVTPESKFNVQPELVPGTRALLTSVDAEISAAELDPFTLVDQFAAKDGKTIPLALLLPRQTLRRMITQTLIQPGHALILAHYVRQYRSAPPLPVRRSQSGLFEPEPQSRRPEPESNGPPATAENLRDHLFYVLSADRRGPEIQSDLPIVPQIPPRYALTLTWSESDKTERPAANSPLPEAKEKQPESSQSAMLSLALTAKTQAQFEIAEERACVAGIHRDSAETTSPYNFLIQQTWTGLKLSAQLEPTPKGVSAVLTVRLADPPQFDDAAGRLPSLRAGLPAGGAGAPEAEAKEYHFQVAGQTSADFTATTVLHPDQPQPLPLAWHTTGIAVSQNARLRQATVSLKEASVPAAETPPKSSVPGAPAVHP